MRLETVGWLPKLMQHKLTQDSTFSGLERLTCTCGETLIRQPFYSDLMWTLNSKNFMAVHATLEDTQ